MQTTKAAVPSQHEQLIAAAKIVGPDGDNDNACSKCHALEFDAWQQSDHFSSFVMRQQDPRTKVILDKMGFKSMKREAECRQCHFTSIVDDGKLVPTWGVVCESCHGPAADWVSLHNKLGGDPAAPMLKWGTGKNQTPAQRDARLNVARGKGMIHSQMIYELAVNCMACHNVPDETLVNKGGHMAGSDFDLVAWSQGEVRHNFADSSGAPDSPTNRPLTPNELRRMYVVGIMVDLQFSLRNLDNVKEKGGACEKAIIDRINRLRTNVAAILKVAEIPELADVIKSMPDKVDGSTNMPTDLADKLATATKEFAAKNDGAKLGGIDVLIPNKYVGKAPRE